jgi:ectoine hydroxylase-related dioxygenase (phytanoyl-CoA dioxygenase family)
VGVPESLMPDISAELESQGFCVARKIAGEPAIDALKTVFSRADLARAEREGETYGARNLLGLTQVRATAALPTVTSCLLQILQEGFRAVRGIFFDKTEAANWPVLWHQDLSLAVQERCELTGWSNWSVKRGVTHVQPPPEILARMVTMRLHLDDCPADNGLLRVVPGSHRRGLLTRDAIQQLTKGSCETVTAEAGDAVFMRPLLLHASSAARRPSHRRVLHLEFAPRGLLPAGLEWAEI